MSAVWRLGLAALALGAIGRQFGTHVAAGASVVNFFSYFTILSNLAAAVVLLLAAAQTRRPSPQGEAIDVLRLASAVNMTIVGLVFTALLRDVDLGQLLPWVNMVVHYVMPVGVALDWVVAPPARTFDRRHFLACLPFPLVYLVYVLVRGGRTGWYPYPFLNPALTGGYDGVVPYVLGIVVVFLVVTAGAVAVANRRYRRVAAE